MKLVRSLKKILTDFETISGKIMEKYLARSCKHLISFFSYLA